MTPAEVEDLLAVIETLWPGKGPQGDADAIVAAWSWRLADVPAPACMAALRTFTGPWPPCAPEIAGVAERMTPAGMPELDEVLDVLEVTIRRTGWAQSPSWPHPVYGRLVGILGGWTEVCARESHWLRREVAELWPTIRDRHARELAMSAVSDRFAGLLRSEPGEARAALER